jgi:DNA-binding NarL/FixJ family response regulator
VITVLLVDDHPVVRAGVRGMLDGEPDISVVGEAASGAEALTAVRALAPTVVLMDLRMPGLDGAAVWAAARGETVLAPVVAGKLMRTLRQPAGAGLSAREVEVLRLVARGLSNGEIGRELFITEATVKTHLLRAFAKLGVSDRTAAVTTALAAGVLD